MKKKTKKANTYEIAGSITVDAGVVQIGDPCYSFDKHDNWIQFLNKNGILDSNNDTYEIPHLKGQDWARKNGINKAVIVSSGFGDGVYDVLVKRDPKTGRIKEMKVKFF